MHPLNPPGPTRPGIPPSTAHGADPRPPLAEARDPDRSDHPAHSGDLRPRFAGLWIPLITPIRGGAVDHAALAALTQQLAGTGIAGFVVCGSTGEAAALEAEEQVACLRTVAEAADGLPLIVGMGGEHLGHVRERVSAATAMATAGSVRGLAGILLPPPFYVRPAQEGVRAWFETLADASGLPVIVYDIPYRTGATISRSTMLQLAQHPNIVAVKDCGGDLAKTLALVGETDLSVLVGEDLQLFGSLSQGATGVIAASAHWRTGDYLALMAAIEAGDLKRARALWQGLIPWIEACFAEPNPGPLKTMLAATGVIAAEWRAPMGGVSPALARTLISWAQAEDAQATRVVQRVQTVPAIQSAHLSYPSQEAGKARVASPEVCVPAALRHPAR